MALWRNYYAEYSECFVLGSDLGSIHTNTPYHHHHPLPKYVGVDFQSKRMQLSTNILQGVPIKSTQPRYIGIMGNMYKDTPYWDFGSDFLSSDFLYL